MWISMAIFAVGSWNPCFFSKQGTIPAGKSVCKGFPVNFDLVGQRLETISINLQTSKFDNIFKWKINYIYGVLWPANWNSELCTAILVGRVCQKSAHGYMRLNAELVNTSVGSNFGCDMTNQNIVIHIYIHMRMRLQYCGLHKITGKTFVQTQKHFTGDVMSCTTLM